jgi:hypothetical protein
MWWILVTSYPSFRKKEPSLPLGTSRDPSGDRSKPLGKVFPRLNSMHIFGLFLII